jgi:arylamine N-acetyltransferase
MIKALNSIFDSNIAKQSHELLTKLLTLFNQQPFTTLDIHNQYRMPLDSKIAFDRTCNDRQCGICYQINGALYHLLTKNGFTASLHTAWVRASDDTVFNLNKESHMTMLVDCEGQKYCIDPGWGDTPDNPLPINGEIQQKCQQDFRVVRSDETSRLAFQKSVKNKWITQYDFNPSKLKQMKDFSDAADFVYSSDYPFYDNLLCTITKPNGAHYTLYNNDLVVRYPDGSSERLDVSTLGGIKPTLVKIFNLTPEYVEKFDLSKAPRSLLHNIQDSWIV